MSSTTIDRINGINSGVAIKAPCRAATTANITLSGEQTIDGVAVVADDRVLVKNQTSGVDNGIYVASTSTWSRDLDFDGARDVVTGTTVYITAGTTNANTAWMVSTAGDITIDTTSIAFSQSANLSAASAYALTLLDDTTAAAARSTLGLVIGTDVQAAGVNIPWAVATGTVDALAANYVPDVTLSDGVIVALRAQGANATTTPTLATDGGVARTITKNGGNPLEIGNISNEHLLRYNLANTRWELLNPTVVIPATARGGFINADMSVAQRGTSFTGIVGSAVQTLDGWFAYAAGGASEKVTQQSGIAANGFNYAIRMERPSGDTSTSAHRIAQIIETRDCYRFQGQVCVLSYYVKAGANFSSTNLTVSIVTGTGADEGNAGITGSSWAGIATPLNTNITATTSWVRQSHAVTIASGATEICVKFLMTPVGTAGAADYVDITGVQLDVGSITPFNFIPYQINEIRCKRLYQKSFAYATAPAQNAGTTNAYFFPQIVGNSTLLSATPKFAFDVEMRISPTATIYNPSAANAQIRNVTGAVDWSGSSAVVDTKGIYFTGTSNVASTLGQAQAIHWQAEAGL